VELLIMNYNPETGEKIKSRMYNKIIEGITKSFENIELNDYHMNKNLSSDNLRCKISISIPEFDHYI
jgi:preprotein translocase subunit SecA